MDNHTVPVIIETELFEKAGRQLKANFALCQRNKKNEYLLSGKIECVCAGNGLARILQQAKPVLSLQRQSVEFSFAAKCEEKGINARVADDLVWKKVAGLMSSPELLAEQVNRWFNSRRTKTTSALVDPKP